MHNIVSLQEGALTCSVFSKFILQWNASFLGVSIGPSGLKNTLLEMLLNRLGGSEMASLLEKKQLRDCIPNNLTFSFDIDLEFKYDMTCKPEYEIMGAKCAYCTQVITLSSKHFDNVTAKHRCHG